MKVLNILKKILNKQKNKNKYNTDDNSTPSKNSTNNPSTKNNESILSDNKNYSDEKQRHKHGIPVNVSEHLHSNSEINNERSYDSTAYASSNCHV